jgi:hypothetical protein
MHLHEQIGAMKQDTDNGDGGQRERDKQDKTRLQFKKTRQHDINTK